MVVLPTHLLAQIRCFPGWNFPTYNGDLKRFITNNISIDRFLHYMQPEDSVFMDTARIKFILSRKGIISNISSSKVKSEVFKGEIMRLLRLCSCNWQIAENGNRRVDAWVQFDIYFRLVRKNGEVKMNIYFNQYEVPDLPM